MQMIHKGRVRWLPKGDAVGQAHFVASLSVSLPEHQRDTLFLLSFFSSEFRNETKADAGSVFDGDAELENPTSSD